MTFRVVLVCLWIGVLSGFAYAQGAAETPPGTPGETPAEKNKRLEDVIRSIDSRLDLIEKRLGTFDKRVAALEEQFTGLSNAQKSNQQALEQLAKRDKDGNSYLRIDASHEPTRNELKKAIDDIAPTHGTLVINNKTSSTESVSVNGKTYDVLGNSSRELAVPYKTFVVRTSNNAAYTANFNYPKTTAFVDLGCPKYWASRQR
jgi:hypothetical protein